MISVDVIVPCYRYGHFLRECVESVLKQVGPALRVLVIDDASPDRTAEVAAGLAEEDSRITFRRHSTNVGHIATYNEGIEWATSKYMLILSADDYLITGGLSRAVNLMEEHPNVGFTIGKALIIYESSAYKPSRYVVGTEAWHIVSGLQFMKLNGSGNAVHTPTVIVRTELQKRLGGYRPELPHTGDMEMWLRLAAHGSVGIIEAYQAVHRRHTSNMSLGYRVQRRLPDLQQRKAALECFFDTCGCVLDCASELKRRFFRSLAHDAVSYANDAFDTGDMEVSKVLSEFAVNASPEIRKSLSWAMLASKRHLGPDVWHFLRPGVAAVRHAILILKHLARRSRKGGPLEFFRPEHTEPRSRTVAHGGKG